MENDCRSRHFWFRRRRFDLRQRSHSEMALSRVAALQKRPAAFSSTGGGLNRPHAAFLVGKRAKAKSAPGARIGYALAYSGAKLGLLPGLPPHAILGVPQGHSVAVQTDVQPHVKNDTQPRVKDDAQPHVKNDAQPHVKNDAQPHVKNDAQPYVKNDIQPHVKNDVQPHLKNDAHSHVQNDVPPHVKNDAQPQVNPPSNGAAPVDLDSPLFACFAPAILANGNIKTFASVGTEPWEPLPVARGMSLPVILTEQRAPSPPLPESDAEAISSFAGLLHPLECLSIARRKSSTGDSAVDLKFGGDEDRSLHSGGPPSPFTSSTPSDAELGARGDPEAQPKAPCKSQARRSSSASWRKLRNVMIWAPFIQQYQRHRYPWIQLAGHQGNFRAGEQGTILKKHCDRECKCLKALMTDHLRPYIPEFKGEVKRDDDKYVCMQDLLMEFESPSLMDCKLGLRTYLEEELTSATSTPTPRKDMYEKMVEVDPREPTEHEHQIGGVTKPRYMKWRETLSSTSTLGFRIEGIKKAVAKSNNDFKRLKSRDDVKACLKDFTDGNVLILEKYLSRLRAIACSLEKSTFFKNHELIGSSLLFVHDHRCKVSIWMIDFGKTVPLPEGIRIDHRSQWQEGNHEDGYLFGLENIVAIFEELLSETAVSSSLNQLAASSLRSEAATTPRACGSVPATNHGDS